MHLKKAADLDPYETIESLCRDLYPGWVVDGELPHTWVMKARERGWEPVGHVVWGYPSKTSWSGVPIPITLEGLVLLGEAAKHL